MVLSIETITKNGNIFKLSKFSVIMRNVCLKMRKFVYAVIKKKILSIIIIRVAII